MSSMLNTTAALQHKTVLPASASPETLIRLLQKHTFFIECDPHMVSYDKVPMSSPAPVIPSERKVAALAGREPECYKVTDRVHALPAGLWDKDVESIYEFVDIEEGTFVRIRSPLGVTMETVWEVHEGDRGHELVEDVVIKCSRLLIGTVRGTCEAGWEGIHAKMVAHLQDTPEGGTESA
ncbi:uncharacterized protein F5Z01DRAFT_644463 [Emericellopsis atlantica]|uniref:DUF7053 domain-containing protein n=1 Tax=Emericellopsis atlantica TaxID=2614577 RepID=A0A9P7ZU56_9HYPO|nr:uncharacterized protein F5Z01DRAFT_644463 [Emericellopsis atlantica]KAG9257872.1 hypothetical protein F5Z01DRAFT_644463 [Emericellopsis atlantica]